VIGVTGGQFFRWTQKLLFLLELSDFLEDFLCKTVGSCVCVELVIVVASKKAFNHAKK